MKLWQPLQQQLGWKLFISYLVVIVVGAASLAMVAKLQAPSALERHTARMETMMGGNMGMMADLNESFQAAVNEVLVVAQGNCMKVNLVLRSWIIPSPDT